MEPLWLHTHKPKGAVEGAEGAICLNGSSGSLKSSLSFVCVVICLLRLLSDPITGTCHEKTRLWKTAPEVKKGAR